MFQDVHKYRNADLFKKVVEPVKDGGCVIWVCMAAKMAILVPSIHCL